MSSPPQHSSISNVVILMLQCLGLATAEAVTASHDHVALPPIVRAQVHAVDARRLADRAEIAFQCGRLEVALELFEQAALLSPVDDDPNAPRQRYGARSQEVYRDLRARQVQQVRQQRSGQLSAAAENTTRIRHYDQAVVGERLRRIDALAAKDFIAAALADTRQLQREHPDHPLVRDLYLRLRERSHDLRGLDLEERQAEALQEVNERLHRSLIPTAVHDLGLYPPDWDERHPHARVELADTTVAKAESDADLRLRDTLLHRIDVRINDEDGIAFIRRLAEQHHFGLAVDPSVLIDLPPVTLTARDTTLRAVLEWTCRLLGVRWSTAHGVVQIGGDAQVANVIALYDISEAVFQVRNQLPRWALGLRDPTGSAVGGGGLFDLVATDEDPTAVAPEDLVDLITQSITPDAWNDDTQGIVIRDRSLIVTAPPATHDLINELLRQQLQRARLLVGIESRWLTMNDDYLEEIGVQWSNRPGTLLDLPGTSSAGMRRTTSQFDVSSELVNNLPASRVASVPASGLSLTGVLLQHLQLSAILSAVEHRRQVTELFGSQLHTMNGTRAFCYFGTPLLYIGGFEVGAGAGNGTTAVASPQISALMLGSLLDVTPFVSADRKYITLDVRVARATLNSLIRESVATVRTIPIGFDPDANGGEGAPITTVLTGSQPIELPNITLDRVETTVMVPDGGTILIGGFTQDIHQSVSAKMPVLGHIPFIGRLFGQRGRYSERMRISLLLSVRLIDYAEAETWR